MTDPFEQLGIEPTSDPEEVRRAYHRLARQWHPDQYQDEERREAATRRMVALNLAYEEALRLASGRSTAPYRQLLTCQDAVEVARRLRSKGNPEGALRQLLRAATRTAEWYAVQGEVLMDMDQFESAQQSFREAIRIEPENLTWRRGALDALVAERKARTLTGRVKHLMKRVRRR